EVSLVRGIRMPMPGALAKLGDLDCDGAVAGHKLAPWGGCMRRGARSAVQGNTNGGPCRVAPNLLSPVGSRWVRSSPRKLPLCLNLPPSTVFPGHSRPAF